MEENPSFYPVHLKHRNLQYFPEHVQETRSVIPTQGSTLTWGFNMSQALAKVSSRVWAAHQQPRKAKSHFLLLILYSIHSKRSITWLEHNASIWTVQCLFLLYLMFSWKTTEPLLVVPRRFEDASNKPIVSETLRVPGWSEKAKSTPTWAKHQITHHGQTDRVTSWNKQLIK